MDATFTDSETQDRLDHLVFLNTESERIRRRFKSESERRAYLLMQQPVNIENTFACLGGFLGTFPPAAIYLKIYFDGAGQMGWLLALFVLANFVTALVGYFLGAFVGKLARIIETRDWVTMAVLFAFVGAVWGMATGFIGGFVIFLVGALFGGALGMVVGAAALPVFVVFHRMLNVAGNMERRILLPLSAGISLIISAYIFGL